MVFRVKIESVCIFMHSLYMSVVRNHGGQVKAKGTIYLSNIRMVFVASKPVGEFFAFDMPLVCNPLNRMLVSILFSFCCFDVGLLEKLLWNYTPILISSHYCYFLWWLDGLLLHLFANFSHLIVLFFGIIEIIYNTLPPHKILV